MAYEIRIRDWSSDVCSSDLIAMFGKRFDDPENRFAGAIQYSVSNNQGKTWSSPHYLHSDTSHNYGRGFFDMAVLPDGEAAAIWLDGRFGEADTGSALFFACTSPGGGFGPDKMIAKSTCECCRTEDRKSTRLNSSH